MGMQAGSSLLDAFAANAEGKLEEKLAKRNAAIAERNAKAVLLKGKFDQLRAAEQAERIMGELEVAIGASGIRGDVGAPMRLLAEQAEELQLDNLLIGEAAQTEAAGLRDQARMLRLGGKMARRRGRAAMTGSLLRGFGQAASGYGQYKSLFSQPPPTGSSVGGKSPGHIRRRGMRFHQAGR
jgi:hypothetical protein